MLAIAALGALGLGYALRGAGRPRHIGVDGVSPKAAASAPIVRVAVLAPDVRGADGRPDVARLAIAVRTTAVASVRARVGLDLVPWGDIESYVEGFQRDAGHLPGPSATRTAVGADEVIAIHIECLPSTCQVVLERDANGSGGPPPETFQLSGDIAAHPGETVTVHLSRLYPDHPPRDAAATASIDPGDHERYVQIVQEYWAGASAGSTDQLLAEIERIHGRSPRSIDVLLFEAEVLRHRFVQTEDRSQAEHALALLHDADELSPDTYDILSARFDIVLAAGEPGDARAILDRLAVLDPDSSVTHLQRAKLHRKRGELERARSELDAAASRDSFSWRVLYYQALVSQNLGDRDATRRAIDKLLKRSPGNYAGLSLRASVDLDAGRLDCAERTYAELVKRKPLYQECVQLGNARNRLGHYREAADSFRLALRAQPAGTAALLNLAESLLLDGDTAAAGEPLRQLRESLALQRRGSSAGALNGLDLLVEAQTLAYLAYLGHGDPALAAEARARTAVLLTATRPDVLRTDALYTAALVAEVLGDRDQAAEYVRMHLEAGGDPAEFRYRWFDNLRQNPVLGPRLAVPPVARSCEPASAP